MSLPTELMIDPATQFSQPVPATQMVKATSATVGAVKPDNTTITINPTTGVISAVGGGGTAYTVALTGSTLGPGQGQVGTTAFTAPATAILLASLYDPTSPGANELLVAFAYNQNGTICWSIFNVSTSSVTILSSTVLNIRVIT